MPRRMIIRPAATAADLEQVGGLFRKYQKTLRDQHALDLAYQGAQLELDDPPATFDPPGGCLLVAESEGRVVGYASLRPLEPGICELKRIFVSPLARRQGLGRQLAESILCEAQRLGYHTARLDLMNTMHAAVALYRSLGFYEISPYTEHPPQVHAQVLFMERPVLPPGFGPTLDHTFNAEAIQTILDGLAGYNGRFAPPDNYQPLLVTLRLPNASLVGGLVGATYWEWLNIEILWLQDHCRGRGFGQQIMALAEAEAVRRGCRHAHVDTLDFQAPDFYLKLGYTIWGQLEDLPPGHTRYFLKKDLPQP